MMYRCKLINNGIIRENFLREGVSVDDVWESLKLFHWPDGEWRIEPESGEEELS